MCAWGRASIVCVFQVSYQWLFNTYMNQFSSIVNVLLLKWRQFQACEHTVCRVVNACMRACVLTRVSLFLWLIVQGMERCLPTLIPVWLAAPGEGGYCVLGCRAGCTGAICV